MNILDHVCGLIDGAHCKCLLLIKSIHLRKNSLRYLHLHNRAVVLNRGATEPLGARKTLGVPPISELDIYLRVNWGCRQIAL